LEKMVFVGNNHLTNPMVPLDFEAFSPGKSYGQSRIGQLLLIWL
jgi:hypothetical protein